MHTKNTFLALTLALIALQARAGVASPLPRTAPLTQPLAAHQGTSSLLSRTDLPPSFDTLTTEIVSDVTETVNYLINTIGMGNPDDSTG
jgi:hypothetical protein